jgi:sodium/potassium-transporting ATPase subunit alpha
MDVIEPDSRQADKSRVRWQAVDEEHANIVRPALTHTLSSNSQMSIQSLRNRRGSIDPAIALPIQYRSVYASNFPRILPVLKVV